MGSGLEHARDTMVGAIAASFVGYLYTDNILESSLLAAGCLCGLVLSPDLDQETITRSEGIVLRRSFMLGTVWVLIWYPYSRLFRHRSIWSHFPPIGTTLRLLYLAGVIHLLWYLLTRHHIDWWPTPQWLLIMLLGLYISDTLHWVRDLFPVVGAPVRKKPRRNRRRSRYARIQSR